MRILYKPDDKAGNSPNMPGGTTVADLESKTKTEHFIDQTKDMSFSEFTNHMLKAGGFEEEASLPSSPPEAISYVAKLSKGNDRVLENLVYKLKEQGLIGKLLETLMDHKESFSAMNELFGDEENGYRRCYFLLTNHSITQ